MGLTTADRLQALFLHPRPISQAPLAMVALLPVSLAAVTPQPGLPYEEMEVWFRHDTGMEPALAGVLQLGGLKAIYGGGAPQASIQNTGQAPFMLEDLKQHLDPDAWPGLAKQPEAFFRTWLLEVLGAAGARAEAWAPKVAEPLAFIPVRLSADCHLPLLKASGARGVFARPMSRQRSHRDM